MSAVVQYVRYNDEKEVDALNLNVWRKDYEAIDPTGATGTYLYKYSPRSPAPYLCSGPGGRDISKHYIMYTETDRHPDHSSRYGFARNTFGYAYGHVPGKFIVSEACAPDPQPPGMAPFRFYTRDYQGINIDYSQADINSMYARNYLM